MIKEEGSKEEDRQGVDVKQMFLVPCVSLYRRIHFP